MEYLEKNLNSFVSVSDILDELKLERIHLGQTTVYRFLNNLAEENKVRIEIRNNTRFYQLVSVNCEEHFHLKCRKCGKLIHLDCEDFNELNNHIKKEHKFIIDNNSIIYGICTKCSKL